MEIFPIQTKLLHMHLPQTRDEKDNFLYLYLLFRNRAQKHSRNGYDSNIFSYPRKKPMMTLYLNGNTTGNSVTQVLVEKDSFKITFDNDGNEAGFTLTIRTIVVDVEYTLYVSKISYKAFLERTQRAIDLPQIKKLYIGTPQRKGLTKEQEYDELYNLVQKHSEDFYLTKGKHLVSKRFHFNGSRFDSLANLRIVRKSFLEVETGFIAVVKTIVDEVEFRLEVFKKQHTARLVRL